MQSNGTGLNGHNPLPENDPAAVHGNSADYAEVLDLMISAEVNISDKEDIRRQGYTRSEANNRDHQVIDHEMNTVYSGLINDLNLAQGKKEKLLLKMIKVEAAVQMSGHSSTLASMLIWWLSRIQ